MANSQHVLPFARGPRTGADGEGRLEVAAFQAFLHEVQDDLLHLAFLRVARAGPDGQVRSGGATWWEMGQCWGGLG